MHALIGLLFALGMLQPVRAEPRLNLVTEDGPYTFMIDGRVGGPATELMHQLMARADITDYDVALYPWARAYAMALRQPDVLIFLMARTPQRETKFKWVGELQQQRYAFYKLRARSDIRLTQLGDAKAWVIGLAREDVRHQYLQGQGFVRLLLSARTDESLRLLQRGRVDLVVLSESDAAAMCAKEPDTCAQLERAYRIEDLQVGLYAACSLATSDARVQRLRHAFEALKKEGRIKL